MKADARQAGLLGGRLEGAQGVAWVAGLAARGGGDVARLVPLRAGPVTFGDLTRTQLLEDGGRAIGDR